jgi:Cu/Ag efflux pump CusA
LISGTGKTGTIGTLAVMREIPGQTEIRRENLQRDVQVTARLEDMNLGDGMAKVQQAIDDLKVPPSIHIQYGGQYE